MPRAITGYGGTLTLGGTTIYVRNVQITRQSSEVDITAHDHTKQFSMAGRVKRGGSFEAYVGSSTSGLAAYMESPNPATPPQLSFTDSGGTQTQLYVVLTGADQTHGADGAATYQVSFVESVQLT